MLDLLDAHPLLGGAMASQTPCAPPLSRRSLRRQPSAIRTGCAKERSFGSVEGCALKAHGVQLPGMAIAAKPSSQPRTESCVVACTALRSVDREIVGRNISERKYSPEIDRDRSS